MADIFWRRKIKRQAKKILLSLPDLPADIDDNVFIALGTQAAEADKNSKAYDEFLFSEEGYEQMPYEDGVQEVLTLQQSRTAERKSRASIQSKLNMQYFEAVITAKEREVEDANEELAAITEDLGKEYEFLTGSKKGEDGGFWEGVAPDTTSGARHFYEKLKEWGIFVVIALADAFVVFLSLRAITMNESEAFWLSFPAIGVQILFPHLVGRSIANARSKGQDVSRRKDTLVAFGVGVAWLAYVAAMTVLRTNLIKEFYVARYQKPMEFWPLEVVVYVFSVMILIGLGAFLMIRAMDHNPHRSRFSRLKYVYFAKRRALRRSESELDAARKALEQETKTLQFIEDQWDKRAASYPQVGEAAKSVYRRALVNQLGTPEFTTEYLPDTKFRIRRSKRVAG